MIDRVAALRERNPMLGLQGMHLGIPMPELVRMQMRAIAEAACTCAREGVKIRAKDHDSTGVDEHQLRIQRALLEEEARADALSEQRSKVSIRVRHDDRSAARRPHSRIASPITEFFSFGTNDLTQTTFGISRDDAETGFLSEYLQKEHHAQPIRDPGRSPASAS